MFSESRGILEWSSEGRGGILQRGQAGWLALWAGDTIWPRGPGGWKEVCCFAKEQSLSIDRPQVLCRRDSVEDKGATETRTGDSLKQGLEMSLSHLGEDSRQSPPCFCRGSPSLACPVVLRLGWGPWTCSRLGFCHLCPHLGADQVSGGNGTAPWNACASGDSFRGREAGTESREHRAISPTLLKKFFLLWVRVLLRLALNLASSSLNFPIGWYCSMCLAILGPDLCHADQGWHSLSHSAARLSLLL